MKHIQTFFAMISIPCLGYYRRCAMARNEEQAKLIIQSELSQYEHIMCMGRVEDEET